MSRLIDIITGKRRLPASVEAILERYGDEQIKNLVVCREPVREVIQALGNILSEGELKRKIREKGYDNIYHLSLILTTTSGMKFKLEKNMRINMELNPRESGECEYVEINPDNITLSQLFKNGISYMGMDKFTQYHAVSNNCQDFLLGVLKGSRLLTSKAQTFIKQDAEGLLPERIEKGASLITDIAGKAGDLKDAFDEITEHPFGKAIIDAFTPSVMNLALKGKGKGFHVDISKKAVSGELSGQPTQHSERVDVNQEALPTLSEPLESSSVQ